MNIVFAFMLAFIPLYAVCMGLCAAGWLLVDYVRTRNEEWRIRLAEIGENNG